MRGGRGCISVTANVAPKLCSDFQKYSKSKSDNEIKEAEREVKRHGLGSYDFRDVDDLYFQSDEQARSEAKDWLNSVI